MEQYIDIIVNQIINNLDFICIININILTYIVIKIIDVFNKEKKVSKILKVICFIVCTCIITILYMYEGYENKLKLANSIIAAPVVWSWIIKPILVKFKVSYKQ